MVIEPSIFKSYDIRAIYPKELDEEGIEKIAKAIFKFFTKKIGSDRQLKVVLSYDMRLSGPALYPRVKQVLVDMGAEVIDIGKTSTPTFYFAVSKYGYDCGIQITASHNPPEYNGLKFVINTPAGLLKIGKSTGMEDIKTMSLSDKIDFEAKFEGKITTREGVLEDEAQNALEIFHNPDIKEFKVVADPANAMGATYIQAIFDKIPGNLIKMNFELDGSFPAHQPDPLNFDNLKDLQKRVLEEGADIGLAPDGDGDRLYLVDEKGNIVTATILTALIAREMLNENPGAMILFDIRYILGSRKIVEEFGGKYDITKVGHAFITEQMTKTGAVFAGESSGHFYYKATGNAESQVATIVAVLTVMTRENKPLSEILEELRRSYESGEFNFEVSNAKEIIEAIKEKYSDGEINEMDGIAITYPEWRVSLRSSNTEPLLRLNIESFDQATMEAKRDEIKSEIEKLAKHE
jgi:phosphomannomutase